MNTVMLNELARAHDDEVRRALRVRAHARTILVPRGECRRCDRATAVRRAADAIRLPLRTGLVARQERVCATC